jgi:hypothetical protein
MKKLDIPCGDGCVAIVMEQHEVRTISDLLHNESFQRRLSSEYAKNLENDFNLTAGLKKEPEQAAAEPEIAGDVPF